MFLKQRCSELTEHNIEQKTTAATAARAATAATAETAATAATASTAATTVTALNLLPEKQRNAKVVWRTQWSDSTGSWLLVGPQNSKFTLKSNFCYNDYSLILVEKLNPVGWRSASASLPRNKAKSFARCENNLSLSKRWNDISSSVSTMKIRRRICIGAELWSGGTRGCQIVWHSIERLVSWLKWSSIRWSCVRIQHQVQMQL